MTDATVAAVMEDFEAAPIDDGLRAALSLAKALTTPADDFEEAVRHARAAGLDGDAIEDVANVGFHFNYINRMADAFDFELPNAERLPVLAKMLDAAKRLAASERPRPSLTETPEGHVRPAEVQVGHRALHTAKTSVAPEMRVAAEAFAARLRGGRREVDDGPELGKALLPYLEKVALHAYRITDDDIRNLFDQGYDEDTIFELTHAAAWGAGVAPLEGLCAALRVEGTARAA